MSMRRIAALLFALSPVMAGADAAVVAEAPKPKRGVVGEVKAPPIPRGTWEAERAERLEKELDQFFADDTAEARQADYDRALVPLQAGLSFDELQAMATPATDAPRGRSARMRTPK